MVHPLLCGSGGQGKPSHESLCKIIQTTKCITQNKYELVFILNNGESEVKYCNFRVVYEINSISFDQSKFKYFVLEGSYN